MAQVPLPILIRVAAARISKNTVPLVSECLDGRKRRVIVSGSYLVTSSLTQALIVV
jgi:hypothetical protein